MSGMVNKEEIKRDLYFNNLCSKITFIDDICWYSLLLYKLHQIEFYAVHPMDDNRAGDALGHRLEYERDFNTSSGMGDGPATVLEVLVGIAIRFSFIVSKIDEDLTKYCFWHLLDNLGLTKMDDDNYYQMGGDVAVCEIIGNWLSRSYSVDGEGGIFPMGRPRFNQREVEIFYQMNQYASDPRCEEWLRSVRKDWSEPDGMA